MVQDEFMKLAESIIGSSRQTELNNKILYKAKIAPDENYWLEEVFSGLAYKTFSEMFHLKAAYNVDEKKDTTSLVAYHTRNILELAIWTEFCMHSDENAKAFYAEVGRDADDLLRKISEFSDDTAGVENTRIELKQRAENKGIEIKKGFKALREVAKDVGMEDVYLRANKLLSKTVHPTPLMIVNNFSPNMMKELSSSFYSQGCLMFVRCIELLEKRFLNDDIFK